MPQWTKYILGKWNWMRPIKSIAFIYLALLVVALGFSDHLLYQPPQPGYRADHPLIIRKTRPGGQHIAMFHLPASPGMPTLLWSHGNAEDIGYLEQRLRRFHANGYGILAYDYPGYGASGGKPGEQACFDACQTAYHHLTHALGIPPENIIIYGQSIGSGPSVWLASRKPCGGLILVTPFVSAFRTVTKIPLFPGDRFNNINLIQSIHTPLLVIHGDNDQVIPQWHGKKLHELHPGPKQFLNVRNAGHNDIYILAGDDILRALDSFWKKYTPTTNHQSPIPETSGLQNHNRASKKSSITAR